MEHRHVRRAENPVPSGDLYAQLEALPEHLTGEITDGRSHAQPCPATPHTLAGSGPEFALRDERWALIGVFQEQDAVTVEPFTEIDLARGGLWMEAEEDPTG